MSGSNGKMGWVSACYQCCSLGDKCKGVLAMHALSGCDTVSYCSGKGKASALKVFTKSDITGLDSVLGEEDATQNNLIVHGTAFSRYLLLKEL